MTTPAADLTATAPVRAVTVDLDDTLYPQSAYLAAAWGQVADAGASLGLPEAQLLAALEEIAAAGSDKGTIIDRALLAVGVAPDRLRLFVPALVDAFAAFAPTSLACYPGVVDALRLVRSRVPLALITDGSPRGQHAKIEALGLVGAFDAVVVSDELGGRHLRKPHPAPFRAALARLGAGAAGTVHIGDRPAKDVAGTGRLGMRCIRVLTGEYAEWPAGDGYAAWLTVADFVSAVAAIEPLLPRREREDAAFLQR
jgi:putative hydrolase of the HAD superfamily